MLTRKQELGFKLRKHFKNKHVKPTSLVKISLPQKTLWFPTGQNKKTARGIALSAVKIRHPGKGPGLSRTITAEERDFPPPGKTGDGLR